MSRLVGPVVPPGTWGRQVQPVLSSGPRMLRPWTTQDASPLAEAYGDLDIRQWHSRSMTLQEAGEWIQSKGESWRQESAADWAVEVDGLIVGRVGFRWLSLDEGCAEIAYWTHPRARGQGHAVNAVGMLTEWATCAGLHRIELHHAVANAASCRVAQACGYRVEGTAVSALLHTDGWHDMHLHGLVAP